MSLFEWLNFVKQIIKKLCPKSKLCLYDNPLGIKFKEKRVNIYRGEHGNLYLSQFSENQSALIINVHRNSFSEIIYKKKKNQNSHIKFVIPIRATCKREREQPCSG